MDTVFGRKMCLACIENEKNVLMKCLYYDVMFSELIPDVDVGNIISSASTAVVIWYWCEPFFFYKWKTKFKSWYSETCLNRTLNKPKTCLNWTLSKPKTCLNWTLSKPKTCLNLALSKPKTCLNWTLSKPKTCLNRTLSKPKTCLNRTV